MSVFTIEAEEMPSGSVSISFREPLFSDRLEASRRYPTSARVGYSLEELLLSMCLVGINGNDLPSTPRDPIQYLRELPHVDGQYLLTTFLGMFTLDEEMSKATRELGMKMKTSPQAVHTVPEGTLPVSGTAFSFQTPVLGTRMNLERTYPGADSNCGYSIEEMLFAYCLSSIDGKPLEASKDYISRIADWTNLDAQYALGIFINAVAINQVDDGNARMLGKSLRERAKDIKSTKATSGKKAKEDTATQA